MLVRRIRSRGANIVVEAHGEVLFAPGTDLSRWKNRFTQRVLAAARVRAPSHNYTKRPLRPHDNGPKLKNSFKASTSTRILKGGGRFYSAVGSTAPYSRYVDQGSGIYAGSGPYLARVLPPWAPGSPSLYESRWRPPAGDNNGAVWARRKVAPVVIKGQRPQFFMDKALRDGFRSMRMRSFQLPGEGTSKMAMAAATAPTGLHDFLGNTPNNKGFQKNMDLWRSWRDRAWNRGRVLGDRPGGMGQRGRSRRNISPANQARIANNKANRRAYTRRTAEADARRKAMSAERSRQRRERERAAKDQTKAKRQAKTPLQRAQHAAKLEMAAWMQRHPGYRVARWGPSGFYYMENGKMMFQPWRIRTADLFIDANEGRGDESYDPKLRGRR